MRNSQAKYDSLKAIILYFFFLAISGNAFADGDHKFIFPEIPKEITSPAEKAQFIALNYWDNFEYENFSVDEAEQIYVDFLNILDRCGEDVCPAAMYSLTLCIKEDFNAIDFILDVSEKYLFDKSSPYKDHEKLIMLISSLINESVINSDQNEYVSEMLTKAARNRIGTTAPDFNFVTTSHEKCSLYSIDSEYTLLFLFDPLCPSCIVMGEEIINSSLINLAMQEAGLNIIFITPFNDPDDQLSATFTHMPEDWTLAFDPKEEIIRKKLYFWDYIPSLYLLDKDKKVILKDVLPENVEHFFER